MAKAMTKSQIVAGVAEKIGITKKQAGEAIDTLAAMAYKNAKNGFTVPGLGKLVLVNRKARMGRNPATGEAIKIPAKRVVKFRVAKASSAKSGNAPDWQRGRDRKVAACFFTGRAPETGIGIDEDGGGSSDPRQAAGGPPGNLERGDLS